MHLNRRVDVCREYAGSVHILHVKTIHEYMYVSSPSAVHYDLSRFWRTSWAFHSVGRNGGWFP